MSLYPVEVFTGSIKVLLVADNMKFFVLDSAERIFVAILENATEAFPIGAEMGFVREGVGIVTFAVAGAVSLRSRAGLVRLNAQYSAATLKKIGLNDWRLIGDLT